MAMPRALTMAAMAKFSNDLNTEKQTKGPSLFKGQVTPKSWFTSYVVGAGGAFFAGMHYIWLLLYYRYSNDKFIKKYIRDFIIIIFFFLFFF